MFYRDLDALAFEPNLLIPGEKPVGDVELDENHFIHNYVELYFIINQYGNIILDYSKKLRNGDISADSPIYQTGVTGLELKFNGDASRIDTDYDGILGSANRTIIVRGKTGIDDRQVLIEYGTDSSGGKIGMRVDEVNNKALRVEHGGGFITGTTNIIDDVIRQHAFVLNGSNLGDSKLYLDGIEETVSASANLGTTINTIASEKVTVGYGTSYISRAYWGTIDYVLILSTNVTQDFLQSLVFDPYQLLKPANFGVWLPKIAAVGGVTSKLVVLSRHRGR